MFSLEFLPTFTFHGFQQQCRLGPSRGRFTTGAVGPLPQELWDPGPGALEPCAPSSEDSLSLGPPCPLPSSRTGRISLLSYSLHRQSSQPGSVGQKHNIHPGWLHRAVPQSHADPSVSPHSAPATPRTSSATNCHYQLLLGPSLLRGSTTSKTLKTSVG